MDVLTLGNAMVDVLALVTDEQLLELGLEKNVWGLLDAEQAERLYDAMPAGVEVSGGSAANTAIGVASPRGASRDIRQGSKDPLREGFVHHPRGTGVRDATPGATDGAAPRPCLYFLS